jgi:hypothetical protein
VAITIQEEPNDICPVYSDIIYTLSSSNSAQTNFKFVAVVKNASGTILAKLKAPIYTGTNYGVFNLSRIFQNYVTFDFTQATLQPSKCSNSFIAYSVEFGEEYNGTEYLNLTSDTGKYAWNGLYSVWESETIADYQIDFPSTTRKFLTTIRRRRVTRAQYDYLYFMRGAIGGVTKVEVKAYDAAGSATTSVISQSFNTSANKDEYLLRVAAGVANLNLIASGNLLSGTAGNIIPAGTVYYTIQLKNNLDDAGSEAYRFDIVEECSKYSPRVLYFLNRLGGFETLRCSMLNRDTYQVERKTLKRNTYGFTGTTYRRDSTAHGVASYSTTKTKKVILNTDFLNDIEWAWVDELISSPIVYLDGTIPVNVINTALEVFDLNDGVQQLRIEVEYTEPEILQNI